MTGATDQKRALLLGADRRFGPEVAARLEADGFALTRLAALTSEGSAWEGDAKLDAVVVDALGTADDSAFLELTDTAFDEGLDGFLDLAGALSAALSRLREGGALVVIASRGYLGGWGGAVEMAFSAAAVGLMRSIALEDTPRGVRANLVACDFEPGAFGADRRARPDIGAQVAGTVAFLVGPDSLAINGEVLLTNSGRSLHRRESRDRRAERPAQPASHT